MQYTRVKRAVSAVVIDGADVDATPDFVHVSGTVTFTPLLAKGDVVQHAGPKGPESLVLAPIECRISDGIIMHRGQEGVFLAAGGKGVQPDVIQWKATFSNMQAGGWAFTLKPVMFDAVPGGDVDLTLVSPIAGASEPIVRGPAGVGLKSITVEGSELVVTVTSEAGDRVMTRIPLEDVVRAEADQAVASAQSAIKADVDAAASSASAAKASQNAAAKSATDSQNAASQTVATAQAAIKSDVAAAAKSASDAQTAASKTVGAAQSAIKADVDAAAASAASAQDSAATAITQAQTATTQAGTATTQAKAASTSAANAKTSETNSKTSETNAGKSATTATNEANRAKTEADRAAQKATEVANTVEGNYSPVGHHHVWADIDDKPATFPPSEHTHTWDVVKNKPATFPPEKHKHTVADVSDLNNKFANRDMSSQATGYHLVMRDAAGRAQFAAPVANDDAANKQYVDSGDTQSASLIPTNVNGQLWAQDMGLSIIADSVNPSIGRVYQTAVGAGNFAPLDRFFNVDSSLDYYVSFWVKASAPNSVLFLELRDGTGNHAVKSYNYNVASSGTYILEKYTVPTEWTRVYGRLALKDGTSRVKIGRFYFNHDAGAERNAQISLSDIQLVPIPKGINGTDIVTQPYADSDTPAGTVLTSGDDGYLHSRYNPIKDTHLARKAYVDAQDAKQLTASEVEAQGATPAAGKVVRRDSAGQVLVPTTAGGSNTAVSRSELTSGLAGKANTSHTHTLSQISDLPNTATSAFAANTVMTRDGNGRAQVTMPRSDVDIANKQYVDNAVASGSKIQVVSSLPSYPDSSTVYIVV